MIGFWLQLLPWHECLWWNVQMVGETFAVTRSMSFQLLFQPGFSRFLWCFQFSFNHRLISGITALWENAIMFRLVKIFCLLIFRLDIALHRNNIYNIYYLFINLEIISLQEKNKSRLFHLLAIQFLLDFHILLPSLLHVLLLWLAIL